MSKSYATKLALAGALLICASAFFSTASADEYHYNNILIGERAMGMGGAYTAISDDPSGLYYNPAGIVYGYAPNLSASVNSFHTSQTTYKDVLGGHTDWNRQSADLIPNFFGVTQPLGDFTVGFSFAVTDNMREDMIQRYQNVNVFEEFSVHLDNTHVVNKIGPSIAMAVNDNLAIGFTLYFHLLQSKVIFTQIGRVGTKSHANGDIPDVEYQELVTRTTEFGLNPVLGVMWSPLERLAFGATLRSTTIITSDTESFMVFHGIENDSIKPPGYPDYNGIDFAYYESNLRRSYPTELSFGAAWFADDRLLLSADVFHYLSTDDTHAVTNLAVGAEYYLSPRWAVRGGAFTNYHNGYGPENEVDLYGVTFSLTRFTRNSSLTMGINSSFGSGKGAIVQGGDSSDMEMFSLTAFLGSSYSY